MEINNAQIVKIDSPTHIVFFLPYRRCAQHFDMTLPDGWKGERSYWDTGKDSPEQSLPVQAI